MGAETKIEWTDATWNPIIGCSRVSEGCRNCYAETIAGRFGGGKETVYSGLTQIVNGRSVWTGEIKETKQLLQPLSWKKPKRVFVNSMSDLFHENVTDEMRDRIFAVMALCPQHTFQVLTKRPERMLAYLGVACGRIADVVMQLRRDRGVQGAPCPLPHIPLGAEWWPLANVWLGVSVEDQAAADERIPLLLQTPAAVRFISAEPLLGPVVLPRKVHLPRSVRGDWPLGHKLIAMSGYHVGLSNPHGALSIPMSEPGTALGIKPEEFEDCGIELDWVICGGESGAGARPMHPDWARGLRDQCVAAGVPFFFKQWGEWWPGSDARTREVTLYDDGRTCEFTKESIVEEERRSGKLHVDHRATIASRVGKKAAGHELDGKVWQQFPETTCDPEK